MYTCDALWVRIIYFNSYCYVIWYTKYFIFVNLFLLSVNVLDFKYKSGGHSVLYLTQTTQMSPDYDNYMIIMMICTLVFVTVAPGRLMDWLISTNFSYLIWQKRSCVSVPCTIRSSFTSCHWLRHTLSFIPWVIVFRVDDDWSFVMGDGWDALHLHPPL